MVELNFDELTDEEIQKFIDRYIYIFARSLKEISEQKEGVVRALGGNPPAISNLNVTPKGTLLFLAKKVARNALISFFTGIEPMHLDSNTGPLFNSYEYYYRQNINSLVYGAISKLEDETRRFVYTLKNSDMNTKREILERIYAQYLELRDVDYGSGRNYDNGEPRQYGLMLALFFRRINNNENLLNMVRAAHNRGAAIAPKYDFYKDVKEVFESYNKNNTKGR